MKKWKGFMMIKMLIFDNGMQLNACVPQGMAF